MILCPGVTIEMPTVDDGSTAFYIGIVLRENAFWAHLYLIAEQIRTELPPNPLRTLKPPSPPLVRAVGAGVTTQMSDPGIRSVSQNQPSPAKAFLDFSPHQRYLPHEVLHGYSLSACPCDRLRPRSVGTNRTCRNPGYCDR